MKKIQMVDLNGQYEDIKDVVKAKKLSQKLQTIEAKFRKAMYDLDDRLNTDPVNQKYSKPLKDS